MESLWIAAEASVGDLASPMIASSPSRKRIASTDFTAQSSHERLSIETDVDMSIPSTITDVEAESGPGGRLGEQGGDTDDRKKDRSKGKPSSRKATPLVEAWKEDVGPMLSSLLS